MLSQICIGILLTVCYPVGDPRLGASQGATFCQLYQPVYWSAKDTRKTKEQIDTMNRMWVALCKKKQ